MLIMDLIVLISLFAFVQGYKEYSPASMCTFGYPHHGTHRAQTSACPISITTNTSSFNFRDIIQVNVTGVRMRGLTLRARSEELDWAKPVGSFIQTPANTRADKWYNLPETCVRHDGNLNSDHLEFVWQATGLVFPPTIYFVATIVQDYETFWINCSSPSLSFSGPATTASPGFPEQAIEQATPFDDTDCSNQKCMRYPNNCEKGKNCEVIIAYENNGTYAGPVAGADVMIFKMWVKDADWVALGFSEDRKMAGKKDSDDGDLVLLCGEKDGRRTAQVGWNAKADDQLYQIHANVHMTKAEVRRDGNEVSCTIAAYTPFDGYLIHDKTGAETIKPNFDYWDQAYCFFLGFGELYEGSPQPMKHKRTPPVSVSCDKKLSTADQIYFKAVDPMIQAHASLNSLAWMILFPAALILARHKVFEENRTRRDNPLWCQLHIILVSVGALFSLIAIILAFAFRSGWSTFATQHAAFGVIMIAVTLSQFILGCLRRSPSCTDNRNFLRAYTVMAFICVGIAFIAEMLAVTLPSFPNSIRVGGSITLVVWLVVFVLVAVILELQSRSRRRFPVNESNSELEMDGRASGTSGGCSCTLTIASYIFLLIGTVILAAVVIWLVVDA